MKVLVTGCHGKIGTAVCLALIARADEVHGIDQVASPDAPFPSSIDTLLDPFAIHRALDRAGRGDAPFDAVIHLAGHTNALVAAPATLLRDNLAIATHVFMGAAGAGIPRIVFGSSIQALLGGLDSGPEARLRRPPRLPIGNDLPARPSNAYGVSKRLAEQMLDHLTEPGMRLGSGDRPLGLAAVSLRLPFVLGPQSIAWNLNRGGPASYEWGGAEAFAYITVDDAAGALIAAASCTLDPDAPHATLFVAAPDPRPGDPIPELVERFYRDVPGARSAIERDSFVDCSAAHRVLGWKPSQTLRAMRSSHGTT